MLPGSRGENMRPTVPFVARIGTARSAEEARGMTSWTFRTRSPSPSPSGASWTAANGLARAVRRIENRLRIPKRSPSRPDMDRPTRDDDARLFRLHVGETRPLRDAEERVAPPRVSRPSRATNTDLKARDVGHDDSALVSDLDMERGTRIEFARPGLQRRELRRLRRGRHAIQDQLDLHGLFASQAERAVLEFIGRSRERGHRCVRIIHGKGRSSARGRPVLKAVVDRWLRRCDDVLAFCPAPEDAGGTGAVHVLLRS